MKFGLKEAPETFQRAMEVILESVKCQLALVFLDDVVVLSNTFIDYINHLDAVLKLLPQAGVSLKLKNCFFFHNLTHHLRHDISPGSLQISPQTKDAIEQFKPPTKVIEL